ncbi:hypothetical protein ONZ45_g12714 [Pleurotus djamor]|nr:hypothetical protein ONZ45_g12714 [Pleurotus djamor]
MPGTVSTLPTELLGSIFVEARKSYWESLENNNFTAILHDEWIYAVCGVCARWRKVARKTPRYWGFISLTSNSERTMDALQMSASSPLRVRGCITGRELGMSHFKSAYEAVLSQFERIEQFSVVLPSANHPASKNFLYPAPILEALRIRHPTIIHRVDLPTQMNTLRTLELLNVIPSVQLPHLPCLTHFALFNTHSLPVKLTWLVKSLKNTPNVEDIAIHVSQFTNDVGAVQLEVASLPCLSRFRFSSSFVTGPMTLFDLVKHPAETTVEYAQAFGLPSVNDLSSIRNLLIRFSDWAGASINQICLSGDARAGIAVFTEHSPSEPHIAISLPSTEGNDDAPGYMDILSALPLDAIPGLVLHGFTCPLSSQGLASLQPFKGVEILKISQCTQDVLSELNSRTGSLPLPNLRRIIVSECDDLNAITSELDYQLGRRQRRNATKLKEICIIECDLDTDEARHIEYLRGFYKVEWDGLHSSKDAWESDSDSSESSDSSTCSFVSGDALVRREGVPYLFVGDVDITQFHH